MKKLETITKIQLAITAIIAAITLSGFIYIGSPDKLHEQGKQSVFMCREMGQTCSQSDPCCPGLICKNISGIYRCVADDGTGSDDCLRYGAGSRYRKPDRQRPCPNPCQKYLNLTCKDGGIDDWCQPATCK
jgi:hypothetical protein